jgi:hypothetical protein
MLAFEQDKCTCHRKNWKKETLNILLGNARVYMGQQRLKIEHLRAVGQRSIVIGNTYS